MSTINITHFEKTYVTKQDRTTDFYNFKHLYKNNKTCFTPYDLDVVVLTT